MLDLMDADIPVFGAVFCVIMQIIGNFFLMNLILAVVIFAFIKTQKEEISSEIRGLQDDMMAPAMESTLMTMKTTQKIVEAKESEGILPNKSLLLD